MFRDVKSKMQYTQLGVGSVICCGNSNLKQSWLIVGNEITSSVFLVSNETFLIESNTITVEDVNFLSGAEFEKLIAKIKDKLNWASSDFFISVRGMKGKLFEQSDAS